MRKVSEGTANWICCQLGAREHYAIPRALAQLGRLDRLYTDYWAGPGNRLLSAIVHNGWLRSSAARFHPELAEAQVKSWNMRSLSWRAHVRDNKDESPYLEYCRVGRQFANLVRHALGRRGDLSPNTVFFAYDTGALEALELLKGTGVHSIVGQIDPGRYEAELVKREEERWPGWALRRTNVPEQYFERREREWSLADHVLVNSEFCRKALVRQGVPEEKLAVMPLAYEPLDSTNIGVVNSRHECNPKANGWLRGRDVPAPFYCRCRHAPGQQLRVLFLGQVILRKGIQYLIEAAKALKSDEVQFDVVGPIGISAMAMKSAPRNVFFQGRVARNEAAEWYRRADVFVLPTISDGFAITQLEAMAQGLPVVATRNCGEVVTEGVDGFIVPPGDSTALAACIARYVGNRDLVESQGAAARRKAGEFGLERLGRELQKLEPNTEKLKR